jgi:hypothetical protein
MIQESYLDSYYESKYNGENFTVIRILYVKSNFCLGIKHWSLVPPFFREILPKKIISFDYLHGQSRKLFYFSKFIIFNLSTKLVCQKPQPNFPSLFADQWGSSPPEKILT